MLTVYRSNRAEWLASIIAEDLRLNPPDLFEKVDIVVNTWPTGRWLGEEIAKTNGISALINFPFPTWDQKIFLNLNNRRQTTLYKQQCFYFILNSLFLFTRTNPY